MQVTLVFGILAWILGGGLFVVATLSAAREGGRSGPRALFVTIIAAAAFGAIAACILKWVAPEVPLLGLVWAVIMAPSIVTGVLLGCVGRLPGPGASSFFAGMTTAIVLSAMAAAVGTPKDEAQRQIMYNTGLGLAVLVWQGVYVPMAITWGKRCGALADGTADD